MRAAVIRDTPGPIATGVPRTAGRVPGTAQLVLFIAHRAGSQGQLRDERRGGRRNMQLASFVSSAANFVRERLGACVCGRGTPVRPSYIWGFSRQQPRVATGTWIAILPPPQPAKVRGVRP